MKVPADSIIAREKISGYLLRQDRNDKSAFLASGGFTAMNADLLSAEIRAILRGADATQVDDPKFGRYYEIVGLLRARRESACGSGPSE